MNLLQALKISNIVKRKSLNDESREHGGLLIAIQTFKDHLQADDWVAIKQVQIDEPIKDNSEKTKAVNIEKGAWQDSTGLIWYPALKGTYTIEQALAKAKELGLQLPTMKEFELAEKEGLRDRFNDFNGRLFWSSTLFSDEMPSAFVFNSYFGRIDFDYCHYGDVSVRFVCR